MDGTQLPVGHHTPPQMIKLCPILSDVLPLGYTLHSMNSIPDIAWKTDTGRLTIWIWLALMTAGLVGLSMTLYWVVERTSKQMTQHDSPTTTLMYVHVLHLHNLHVHVFTMSTFIYLRVLQ